MTKSRRWHYYEMENGCTGNVISQDRPGRACYTGTFTGYGSSR